MLGCSSVGRTSDRHAADSCSIPRCGKGVFLQSHLSVQTLLRCPHTLVCNRMHLHRCARWRSCSPWQSSMDYGNAKTPSMHCRLGSATLLQLLSLGKATQNSHGINPVGTIQLTTTTTQQQQKHCFKRLVPLKTNRYWLTKYWQAGSNLTSRGERTFSVFKSQIRRWVSGKANK